MCAGNCRNSLSRWGFTTLYRAEGAGPQAVRRIVSLKESIGLKYGGSTERLSESEWQRIPSRSNIELCASSIQIRDFGTANSWTNPNVYRQKKKSMRL